MLPKHASVPVEESDRPTSAKESDKAQDVEADAGSNPESDAESDAESDSKYLAEHFGALLSIGADSLEKLASRIRKSCSVGTTAGVDSNDCQLVSRLNGSYNLIHVAEFADGVKYVIRVPLTAQEGRFDEKAKQEMRAHALTLRYIRTKTGLQIPDVLDFDITNLNEIGAPYIAMSFLEGMQISEKWFCNNSEDSLSTSPSELASLRCRILDSVAEAMSKLRHLEFDKVGSMHFSDDTANDFHIGPCYYWDEGDIRDDDYGLFTTIKEFGPFTSSRDFLKPFIKTDSHRGDSFPLVIGSKKLTSWIIDYLPLSSDSTESPETFVLSPPDFDSQNFLIDDEGNLTEILDWDTVHTVPDMSATQFILAGSLVIGIR